MFEFFLVALSALFVIINPLTLTFLSVTVMLHEEPLRQKELAWKAFMIATTILVAFAVMGRFIFQFVGVTLGAFKIAGGIILFSMSMSMIGRNKIISETYTLEDYPRKVPDSVAIMPLAIPFLSGPGSITTVMVLATKAVTYVHMLLLVAAIMIIALSCYNVRHCGQSAKKLALRRAIVQLPATA